MKLQINGEQREVPSELTIRGLLDLLELRSERVAVEVNAEVVKKAHHVEHRLAEGDEVEIVTFVGGG